MQMVPGRDRQAKRHGRCTYPTIGVTLGSDTLWRKAWPSAKEATGADRAMNRDFLIICGREAGGIRALSGVS
jgi:hypothetical protein